MRDLRRRMRLPMADLGGDSGAERGRRSTVGGEHDQPLSLAKLFVPIPTRGSFGFRGNRLETLRTRAGGALLPRAGFRQRHAGLGFVHSRRALLRRQHALLDKDANENTEAQTQVVTLLLKQADPFGLAR